jgi:hypothetical protein
MKALLTIAALTQQSSRSVSPDAIDRARSAGATAAYAAMGERMGTLGYVLPSPVGH